MLVGVCVYVCVSRATYTNVVIGCNDTQSTEWKWLSLIDAIDCM
jgi:hypothetical protein